jgi:hypothetical protein
LKKRRNAGGRTFCDAISQGRFISMSGRSFASGKRVLFVLVLTFRKGGFMPERQILLRALDNIGKDLRKLEILYERYFSGEEKREPLYQREALQKRLRQFVNRRIMKTDLRFRYESLAARYHTYTGYWDRILRLMDEGRYERHTGAHRPPPPVNPENDSRQNENESTYQQMLKAHQECSLKRPAPSRQQFDAYLAKQRSSLAKKFGSQEIEFRIVTEAGKPKIKARPKKTPTTT